MDMSGTGQLIATASSDTTARIWVPERVDCVRILAGHHFDVDVSIQIYKLLLNFLT